MPFTVKRLEIPDVMLIEPKVFHDGRGCFAELFKRTDFSELGLTADFVQDNYSRSQAGVLRGLHYQAQPKAQGKLVYVLRGSVFDVAVDVRLGSPTYGKWVSTILDDQNHHMLWVPPGFAHGFCVLSDSVDFIYKCTDYYDPASERGLCWDDPALNIAWPIAKPILSPKDLLYPRFENILENDLLRHIEA